MNKRCIAVKAMLLGIPIQYNKHEDWLRLCGPIGNDTELVVFEEIDEIADWAFADNINLNEIQFSSKLKMIGHCAFLNCKNVKKLSMKTENGEIIYFDDVNIFIKQFKGIVESGAFENCFGNSILVNVDSENEEKTHLKFENALCPAPFYKKRDEEIFVKILSDNDDGKLHISLINYEMILYDMQYFNLEHQENEKIYYRPYFYEFLTERKDGIFSEFVTKHLDMWMIGKVVSYEDNNSYEHSLKGEVLFSASPIRFEKMQLVIQDAMAPTQVTDKIKKVYELTNAYKVQSGNKMAVLDPIIKSIIDGANPDLIKVFNVGQAACNYIYFDNMKRVMFDVGYSYKKEDYKDICIKKNRFIFENCKPHLIILSHWDLDHIMGVAYSKDSLFKVNWIAPSMEKLPNRQYSISAARLAKYLCWKKKLYLIDEGLNGENIFYSGSFQIWKGEGKGNTDKLKSKGKVVSVKGVEIKGLNKANNIGLIITLKNNNNEMLLPGDCEYLMIPSKIYSHNTRYDTMIVPHHGSSMALIRPRRHPKVKGRKENVIISAGYNTYKPRHPWEGQIKFLKRLKYNVYQTSNDCKNGYLIKIDLKSNNIL